MKTITTTTRTAPYIIRCAAATIALALMAACTPHAHDEPATAQPVALMPTATIVSHGTATRADATTAPDDEVAIALAIGTLQLTMDGDKKAYTVDSKANLTTTTPHKATAGKHTFSVDEAKVVATIALPDGTTTTTTGVNMTMNLKVAMEPEQQLDVVASGAVTLPLAPTTAGMRLVLKMDTDVNPTSVTCVPSNEKAPLIGATTNDKASRIVQLSSNTPTDNIYAVAFGMLPAGTAINTGTLLATITTQTPSGTPGSLTEKNLALLAPAPLTLAAGEMVTYTVHVDHSLATITGVTIGGFTEGNGTGDDIGVGDNRIAMADGTNHLDQTLFNEKNPVWNITGDGANETADNTILGNVKTALFALNVNNNGIFTSTARIDVILPNFAGTIVDNAFFDCAALASISAPKATDIGSYAFANCSTFVSVNLPVATSIGASAFSYCIKLATISLPAATSIGKNAFSSALTRLELTGTTKITMDSETFLNNVNTGNITLVLHSKATNAAMNVDEITDTGDPNKGKNSVTFNTASGTVAITFAAVEYIN